MTAPRSLGPDEPVRAKITEALTSLTAAAEVTVWTRYAEMYLREASRVQSNHDEAQCLASAERDLGRTILASANPSQELRRAFRLIVEARTDATD